MIGIIEIEDMEFFGRHGCFSEERTIGNKFIVNLRLETDVRVPSESDNIVDAVNYQTAYNIVKEQIAIPSNLLENVAKRILEALYDKMDGVKKATVKVSKVNPPMGGQIKKVSVTLTQ